MPFKKANVHKFTMPLDEMEDILDVPRNESVGISETEPKNVPQYNHKFKPGDSGSDTKFVPRDSGDGLGGPKPTFAPVEAYKATSGNPDSYFQPYLENKKAEPSKFNKTASAGSDNEDVAKLRVALADAEKKLRMERVAGQKRAIAREIVQADIEHGFFTPTSDKDVMQRVASIAKSANAASLERELARVRALPTVKVAEATAEPTVGAKPEQYTPAGVLSGISSIVAGTRFNAPTVSGNHESLREALMQETQLGRNFGNAPKNPKEF